MSGGGLLEKAMGQQMSSEGESMVNEVVAEALPQPLPSSKLEISISVSYTHLTLPTKRIV